jgi:PAS domain-containing protein
VREQNALLEGATIGIAFLREGRVARCNPRFEEIFGYGQGELLNQPVLPLYVHALESASPFPWTEGHSVRVVSPEGLIVTKLVSFRPQDQEDIRTLLAANRDDIDVDSIRREWGAVALGEESRTNWLEAELAAVLGGR